VLLRALSERNAAAHASRGGDRALESIVGAQRRGPRLERRGHLVAPNLNVGVGEDEINSDALQRDVLRKQCDVRELSLEGNGEVGRVERGLRDIFGDMCWRPGEALSGDQPLPQDDVRFELLHHDHEVIGIVVMQRRSQAADVRRDARRIACFKKGAIDVERPALARDANKGKRLLDAHAAVRTVDEED